MSPYARVILDSVSPIGIRLTTMEVRFHRFVLAEFNTHRDFSRNSASSRAIPVFKTLARVAESPAMPIKWAAEKPGMQGGDSLEDNDLWAAQALFDEIHQFTVDKVEEYLDDHPDPSERLHKGLINRLLEPWVWHTVIVTSTEWDNFFEQRCSPLAQPEIEAPANLMREALNESTPTPVGVGEWHLPYVQPDEQDFHLATKQGLSVARCARVSYLNHDGKKSFDDDMKLYSRLINADPPHFSPFEHAATPVGHPSRGDVTKGNFKGWHQLRGLLEWDKEETN